MSDWREGHRDLGLAHSESGGSTLDLAPVHLPMTVCILIEELGPQRFQMSPGDPNVGLGLF